jgi:hypothetical protein
MKFVEARPILDAVRAARKLMELANGFEPVQMREGPLYTNRRSLGRHTLLSDSISNSRAVTRALDPFVSQ